MTYILRHISTKLVASWINACYFDEFRLLDSIWKSRDITLPTKVHLVKAMVFPVVMYACDSWTVKRAEHQRRCF